MTSAAGNNGMAAQPGASALTGNHGNGAYMSSQAAAVAALKQQQQQHQQILEQQKQQQQYMQRQQLMAEQVEWKSDTNRAVKIAPKWRLNICSKKYT